MRAHLPFVMGAALASVAAFPWWPQANAADAAVQPMLDIRQLKPGAKGYGLTVFSGTEPERFDVEVISVLKTFLPNQDLILVKTNHPRLQVVKVVGGMSGSPIFIDGKLVGAYAYGWQFGLEAVAGVTPIKNMLEDFEHAKTIPPEYLLPVNSPKLLIAKNDSHSKSVLAYRGNPGEYDLQAHAKQVGAYVAAARTSASQTQLTPVDTPLMVGGVGETGMRILRENLVPLGLEPLQGGGGASTQDPDAPTKFVDGGTLGVQLIRGDISAAGIGTVTHVMGDRLVGFGHPMMQSGASRMPTAISTIHWVLASTARSFKIGSPVRPMGSLIDDRQAAIVVDSKVDPPVFPVKLTINGVAKVPHPVWNMEVAHERFMGPLFVAVALGNAVDATTREQRDVTWHAYTTLKVRGRGSITLHDFGVSSGGTPDAGTFMMSRGVRAIGTLLNNPWEPVIIDGVETKLDMKFSRDLLTIRGCEAVSPEIDAGQKAKIRVHLVPYAGPEQVKEFEVEIPKNLGGQYVDIEIVPGHQVTPEVPRPESVADLMANLPKLTLAPDVLVAIVRLGEAGVTYKGQIASRLPPGALDTIRPANSSLGPDPFPSVARTIIPLNNQFVVGRDYVRIRVREVMR